MMRRSRLFKALAVERYPNWMRVIFSSAPKDHADYHYQWLRHNCEVDRHPTTKERIICPSDVPDSIVPKSVRVTDADSVEVVWDGPAPNRTSTYTSEWLKKFAYAQGRELVPPPPNDVPRITINAQGEKLEDVVRRCIAMVRAEGIAVVRGAGLETESIIDTFAAQGLFIRPTHFGRIEDLRTDNKTNKNTDQLGYTDYPVRLHSDQCFIEQPPKYQLLQCMTPAPEGGENYLTDAKKAIEYLKSIDKETYDLLTTVPVCFHRVQKNFESIVTAPIITLEHPKYGFVIRYSYFTMDPHRIPFDVMSSYYRAYTTFTNLISDPRHHYHAPLGAGDYVFYDNHRMCHARKGFKGARWMRGIYFDEIKFEK
jgi:gamma-butyrobetaine dioxygenase/trimethyllysine dioxygenase